MVLALNIICLPWGIVFQSTLWQGLGPLSLCKLTSTRLLIPLTTRHFDVSWSPAGYMIVPLIVHDRTLDSLKASYEEVKVQVKICSQLGLEFVVGRGVKQSCPL